MSLIDYSRSTWESIRQRDFKHPIAIIRSFVQWSTLKYSLKMDLPQRLPESNRTLQILVICCYMADRPNLADELIKSVKEAKSVKIDLVLTNNSSFKSSSNTIPYVKYTQLGKKFDSVEKIIKKEFKSYHDYVIIIDDDVKLPLGFFDKYFKIVNGFNLIVSQPAVSYDSNEPVGKVSKQIAQSIVHLSSFIETGPVTCFERKAVSVCPFSGGSPMGWGLDFVWAYICRENGWRMGVVDFVPVQHKIRKVAEYYASQRECQLMWDYLSKVAHMPRFSKDVIGQIISVKDYTQL